VSFEDRNPRRAALIADEYSTQYINLLREEKTADYRYARKWLSEQIELVRGQLDGAEESLSAYRPKVGIQALEQSYEIALETMRNLTREIETSRNEIATLTAEKEAGQSPSLRTVLLAEDARYNQLTTRLRELELQRLSLIAQNTANHPDVKRLSAEIDVLNEQIASGVTLLLGEVSARRELASIRLDSLQQRLAEQAVLLNDLQEQKQRYESAEREVAAIREVYQSLLDRSKELDVTSEFESTNVTILSKASVPEYPSSPKIMRTMAIFSTVGLGFGVGLVFLLSAMDRSVKDPRKVESQLGMPTLGFVPFLKASSSLFGRKRPDRERLIPHSDASSPEAEAFRVLRTALQYSSAGQPPKVIVITSCLPKEGKSTVAANLAASYALRGDRVLLIDADLKAPVIHKTFEKSREPGLSDILTGQKLPEAAIMPSGVDNLDLLTAGPATPSPADLLESKSMHDLLARLRGEYSLIVVDSAPIFGMADTLVLSRATDGICLLVNRGETPNDVLQKVARQLFQLESRILGVIYNDRMRRTKLYGGYGYGYGYGADEERRESYSA
jgi:capsular exopolysaccharide synthesis family protein